MGDGKVTKARDAIRGQGIPDGIGPAWVCWSASVEDSIAKASSCLTLGGWCSDSTSSKE